jgi:4-hydroxythreonine-4-phosphate dehydrogenase
MNEDKPKSDLPRIGVTLGDPAGIGPEVALKALRDDEVRRLARFAVFGPSFVAWTGLGGAVPSFVRQVRPFETWDGRLDAEATLLVRSAVDLKALPRDRPSAPGGEASISYVLAAVEAAQRGWIDAIVTGPISKDAIHQAGYPWPGHTELLAEKFGAERVAMMFAGGPLRVVLVTIHLSLLEAIRALTVERILGAMRLANEALRRYFGLELPRVGVCGLNPHASEAGRFGHEEREIIGPAIEQARAEGIAAFGPLAPDTAFHQALQGKFDLIVALYHDQGLIAVKSVAFDQSVNVTLGLPIIRTSVDHGTAYDIAGRGKARPESMKAAIRLAVEMVRRRR